MPVLQFRSRAVGLAATCALLAGVVAVIGPRASDAASVRRSLSADLRTSFTVQGELTGVATTSATNAWAVGSTGPFGGVRTLIAHWNGRAWKQVPSPSPGRGDYLNGVAATSARNAWAVGSADGEHAQETLILHWNGRAWKRVPSPTPAPDCDLVSVAATSARNAWAVGFADPSGGDVQRNAAAWSRDPGVSAGSVVIARTLILHWNGTSWRRVPSPNPEEGGHLTSVTALSARSAWAVGEDEYKTIDFANLILHWNGTGWKPVPGPNPAGGGNGLVGVAATSHSQAWAIGLVGSSKALMERWNGTRWKQVPIPESYALSGITAASARETWSVGGTTSGVLILRWNGVAWVSVPASDPGKGHGYLTGVAASSTRSAWAVGNTSRSSGATTLILHWNGTSWN